MRLKRFHTGSTPVLTTKEKIMSQIKTHFGKLHKVEIKNQTIEEWCEFKCKEAEIEQLQSYYSSWKEQMHAHRRFHKKYFIVNDEVWEVVEHVEFNDGDDIDIMIPNEDGTITFVEQFDNGGTCLSECIENGIRRLKDKNK
jgi:hypothetical protein